jgi:hypothetical protein
MKESYGEELATHIGLDPYAGGGNVLGVASARGTGRLGIWSSEILTFVCRPCNVMGKTTRLASLRRGVKWHGGVEEPQHVWKLQTREPGEPIGFPSAGDWERSANLTEDTADLVNFSKSVLVGLLRV